VRAGDMESQKGIDIADFPTIFQSLTAGRRTGNLKVTTDIGVLFFFFQDGIIKHYAQPARDDVLLRAMLRSSKIDRAEYDRLLSRHQRTGRSYHSIFGLKRSIDENDIRHALQFMVQEEVCDLFASHRLSCEFFDGEPLPEVFGSEKQRVALSISPEPVVMEAARRMDEISLLREAVPSLSDVYTGTGFSAEECEPPLPPEDESLRNEVLELIDGQRDLNELAEIVRMSKFDLLRTVNQLVTARLIEPHGVKSLMTLAQQYAFQGNIRKSLRLYERAEELGESGIETRMHVARLYAALGEEKRAISKYLSIAETTSASNDTESSIAALRQALDVNQENTEIREKLTALLIQADRYDEAANESIELANLFLKLHNLKGAIQVWCSFMDKYPTSTEAHRQLAELYKEQDNKTTAIQTLENLAELYLARKRRDRASEVYREILDLDPRHTRVRLKLASVLRRMGNVNEAAEVYEQFRSTTRMLKFTEKPQTIIGSWFGLKHPALVASARLGFSTSTVRSVITIALALTVSGFIILAVLSSLAADYLNIPSALGMELFNTLTYLQIIMLFVVLPYIASSALLLHPREEDTSIAAQLAAHPRATVAGKFLATFAIWTILLISTLPTAIAANLLDGIDAAITFNCFYLNMLFGVVICAALTFVSANATSRKTAIIDSYLACALLLLLASIFISLFSLPEINGLSSINSAAMTAIFLSENGTFIGTGILMPLLVVFVTGFMLIGTAARLMPERSYWGYFSKLFWLTTLLLATIFGILWVYLAPAINLDFSGSCLIIPLSILLGLSVGIILFSTDKVLIQVGEKEKVKQILGSSHLKKLIGPGSFRSSIFAIAVSAVILIVLVIALGNSSCGDSATDNNTLLSAGLYITLLGALTFLASLGLILSAANISLRRARLILIIVFGFLFAAIPAAASQLHISLPQFLLELSPLSIVTAIFADTVDFGKVVIHRESFNWTRIALPYWILSAILGTIAVLWIRKISKGGKPS